MCTMAPKKKYNKGARDYLPSYIPKKGYWCGREKDPRCKASGRRIKMSSQCKSRGKCAPKLKYGN